MVGAISLFLKASFGFFLTSFIINLVGFLIKSLKKLRIGLVLLVFGWLALAIALGLRWQIAGRAPLSNQYESLLFLLWAVLAVYFLFLSVSYPTIEWFLPYLSGFALFVMGLLSLLDPAIEPLMPALQSNWLLIHVITVMLGYAALTLAFLGAIAYLLGHKFSKVEDKKAMIDPTTSLEMSATSERQKLYLQRGGGVDPFLYRSTALGFWLLTLGIITGAVWANSAWGSYWSWDPKETWSLVTWIFYAITIHLRRTRGWKGKRFAWLLIAGFGFVVFTYFGVNYLLSGLHSYA